MADISINYNKEIIEFDNVPHKDKKMVEGLLHSIEKDTNTSSKIIIKEVENFVNET